MSVETFYPENDAGTTTADGVVGVESQDDVWATVRAATGNVVNNSTDSSNGCYIATNATTDHWTNIFRSIFTIDVSGFTGDPDDITKITFSFYPSTIQDNFAQDVCFVNSSPASNSNLVATDYGNVGTTQYAADLDVGALSTGQYNSFTLNATGIAAVKAAIAGDGIFKCGMRFSGDRTNTAPTWASSTIGRVVFAFADNATQSRRPVLTITYTGEETAAIAPISITATIPSITATYVYEQSATFTPISVSATIPSVTGVWESVWTAAMSAISIVVTIPSFIASWKGWEFLNKNTSTYTYPAENTATYTEPTENTSNYSYKTKN
jgi:hypothetical protein